MCELKNCPACSDSLVFPRGDYPYCEECGWPDEDFSEQYEYPKVGTQLGNLQPGLQFFNERTNEWVPSGVITKTMHSDDRGFYRFSAKASGLLQDDSTR